MKRMFTCAIAAALLSLTATPVAAYVGPGAGLSLLGALWGLILAVLAALSFVIFWPLRRYLRKTRARRTESQSNGGAVPESDTEGEHARQASADGERRP